MISIIKSGTHLWGIEWFHLELYRLHITQHKSIGNQELVIGLVGDPVKSL